MVIFLVPVTPELSCAVALTVTVPAVDGVSIPVDGSIVAEPVPLVTDQVTAGFEAVVGNTAAFICRVLSMATVVAESAPVTFMLDTLDII